jgi:peroxiredoxin
MNSVLGTSFNDSLLLQYDETLHIVTVCSINSTFSDKEIITVPSVECGVWSVEVRNFTNNLGTCSIPPDETDLSNAILSKE